MNTTTLITNNILLAVALFFGFLSILLLCLDRGSIVYLAEPACSSKATGLGTWIASTTSPATVPSSSARDVILKCWKLERVYLRIIKRKDVRD
jgi:hypothetical protein